MREIKFRAWDVSSGDGFMSYSKDWTCLFNKAFLDDDPIMQYTGLNDKNGVEIYEGDIVRIYPTNTKHYGNSSDFIVEMEIDYFGVETSWNNITGSGYECPTHIMEDDANFEVIGNIYENSELMI